MDKQPELDRDQRLLRLLQHLEIPQAHFATRQAENVTGLISKWPEVVASLTFICPGALDPELLAKHADRVLCVRGTRGPGTQLVGRALAFLPAATEHVLEDYFNALWADTAAERTVEVGQEITAFLDGLAAENPLKPVGAPASSHGEVAGLMYQVAGSGPPVILLPLGFAPSQWEPLLARLSAHYCTIVIRGAALEPVANLEVRAQSGYSTMVLDLVEAAELRPGESVLEVGCGSGALARRLCRHTAGRNPVVALDLNPFLLGEAEALARQEGLDVGITFRLGNAEALSLPDSSFDVVVCSTVLEEADADTVIAELRRVTRPGGRVAVVVRAIDRPQWVHLPLSPNLQAKVENLGQQGGAGVASGGCADASLYERMQEGGLTDVRGYPHSVTVPRHHAWAQRLLAQTQAALDTDERAEWRAALHRAERENLVAWIARPFHCAIGTKPK